MTSLADEVLSGSVILLDTNAIIYYVEEHPKYIAALDPVVSAIVERRVVAHASVINLSEVLVRPLSLGQIEIADRYREILHESFLIHGVDEDMAERAAAISAKYGLKTADAIVCATAVSAGCGFLITNDPKLRRLSGLRVLVIDDYV